MEHSVAGIALQKWPTLRQEVGVWYPYPISSTSYWVGLPLGRGSDLGQGYSLQLRTVSKLPVLSGARMSSAHSPVQSSPCTAQISSFRMIRFVSSSFRILVGLFFFFPPGESYKGRKAIVPITEAGLWPHLLPILSVLYWL